MVLSVFQQVLSSMPVLVPGAQLEDGKACEYRKAADVFANLDAGREQLLLDEEDRILREKGEKVSLPCNT
jgi:hypothetical protein